MSIETKAGRTALIWASEAGHLKVVKTLIKAGVLYQKVQPFAKVLARIE